MAFHRREVHPTSDLSLKSAGGVPDSVVYCYDITSDDDLRDATRKTTIRRAAEKQNVMAMGQKS